MILITMESTRYLTTIILDTIIFHATTATMLEGSEESSAQQTFVTIEKRTTESDLRFAASFAVEWQSDTLFTDKH